MVRVIAVDEVVGRCWVLGVSRWKGTLRYILWLYRCRMVNWGVRGSRQHGVVIIIPYVVKLCCL